MRLLTAYILAAAIFSGLVLAKYERGTGFTGLERFGDQWENRRHPRLEGVAVATVPKSYGYDGQFYAQLALDPLLLNTHDLINCLDAPGYRARRIAVPLLAGILGGTRPWWVLQTYALINVVCWFALGLLLHRELQPQNWQDFARWVGCLFGMGVLESVRQSLVDLPALLIICLSIRAHRGGSAKWPALWEILGSVTKETSLLATLAVRTESLRSARSGRLIGTMTAISAPLLLWVIYVSYRFPSSGGAVGLGNFDWPFVGVWQFTVTCTQAIAAGNLDSRFTMGMAGLVAIVTQVFSILRRTCWESPWWRIAAFHIILLACLSSWVWSGYWAALRAVLPLTIAFNLLLPATGKSFWPVWIAGNLPIVHAVWRFL